MVDRNVRGFGQLRCEVEVRTAFVKTVPANGAKQKEDWSFIQMRTEEIGGKCRGIEVQVNLPKGADPKTFEVPFKRGDQLLVMPNKPPKPFNGMIQLSCDASDVEVLETE